MVAALTVRMLLLPVGLLANVPMVVRLLLCGLSLLVMVSHPNRRMVPALMAGTLLMVSYGFWVAP
jgi:hypothetical protein